MQQHAPKVLRLPRTNGWISPKCCACWENCNSSSENNAKVLRLPHKTTCDTFCRHVRISSSATPATRNEATLHLDTCGTFKSNRFCRTQHRHGHAALTRTPADSFANGCGRLRSVWRTQPPNPQNETGTLATHSGKKQKGP